MASAAIGIVVFVCFQYCLAAATNTTGSPHTQGTDSDTTTSWIIAVFVMFGCLGIFGCLMYKNPVYHCIRKKPRDDEFQFTKMSDFTEG